MTRRLTLILALLTSLSLFAQETQRYLVATKTTAAPSRIRVLAEGDAHRVRTFHNFDAFAADLTAAEVAELRKSEGIELVAPVVTREALADVGPASGRPYRRLPGGVTPLAGGQRNGRLEAGPTINSPESELASSYGVKLVRAPEVWPVTRGQGVNVAVLDTGIDLTHPDLEGAIAGGYNTLDPSKSPQDDNKHGSHVAGIVGARANSFGVVGVAPKVTLWAVKVLDAQGNGTDETVVAGIDWVMEKQKSIGGRWVINFSLGANSPSEFEQRAVERALAANIVIVAAAGNRTPWVRYPARYPGVIAVGAVDKNSNRTEFSSTGYGISIMAPGNAVLSTMPQGTIKSADIRPPNEILPGFGLIGSPLGVVVGQLMYAGYGRPEDLPADLAGHIALMERGLIPFREKARNVKEAGAIAAVIWNNVPAEGEETWTMKPLQDNDPVYSNYEFPLTIGVQQGLGLRLLEERAMVEVAYRDDPYGHLNGTSMASPHVAGIVALMLALAPSTPVLEVKYILERTAHDLENPGWDINTGFGVVDALAAAQYVAPDKFGVPPPDPDPSNRRRSVH